MREILELCIRLDRFAHTSYEAMAAACGDPDIASVFARMAKEERAHVVWWEDLLGAWDKGLIPDIVSDTEALTMNLRDLADELPAMAPESYEGVSTDQMLEIAARVEFFLLDPVFGELIEITDPGGARSHRDAYGRHIERLVSAIEASYSSSDFARFLARVLRRTWHDSVTLAMYATRDPLTTLHNRRGMSAHLRHWLAWAERYERPVSVVLVDVDDFKSINDTYGHAVGDSALREIARGLLHTVRGSDIVVRYGGDEFAIIAPESDLAELTGLMERIVHTVRTASVVAQDGSKVPLSVSVGGAVADGAEVDGTISSDTLLAAADRALYRAKRSGKDRAALPASYPASV